MQAADPVAIIGETQRQRGHVEFRTARAVRPAQFQKLLSGEPQLLPIIVEVFLHHREVKHVVTCGNRGMGGKDSGLPYRFRGPIKRPALGDQFAYPFQHQKGTMSLVEMPDGGVQSQGPHGPDAADAQHDFLTDAGLPIAAVEAGGERPIPRFVLRKVGIHQTDSGTAHLYLPEGHLHGSSPQGNLDPYLAAFRVQNRADGSFFYAEGGIDGLLPAVRGDMLAEIPLRVQKPYPDQREAQVAGLFGMIAGQNAQSA